MLDRLLENGFWYTFFALMAMTSTAFFLIRLMIAMVFGDSADSHDIAGDVGGFDTDASFELFSIQSMLAFFMAFGWMGLAGLEAEWGMSLTVTFALVVGLAMMAFNGFLTLTIRRFNSVHVYNPRTAVGQRANTYLTIPKGGRGQVEVIVSGAKQVLPARSTVDFDVPSFTAVVVEDIDSDGTLVVAPVTQPK